VTNNKVLMWGEKVKENPTYKNTKNPTNIGYRERLGDRQSTNRELGQGTNNNQYKQTRS
jgi:hypothetical protein